MRRSKFITTLLVGCVASTSSYAMPNFSPIENNLSAEAELACTVILCMASSEGYKVAECRDPIRKYFRIKAKKWHKTIEKRRNFLKLCPDETASDDMKLSTLTHLYAEQAHGCDAKLLNKQVETRVEQERDDKHYIYHYYHRTLHKLPKFCENLYRHEYTDWKKPRNVCSGDWCDSTSWARGSLAIKVGERYVRQGGKDNNYYEPIYRYEPIQKECWVE